MIPNIFSLLGESIVGKHIAKGIIFSNSPKKFHPNGSRIQVYVRLSFSFRTSTNASTILIHSPSTIHFLIYRLADGFLPLSCICLAKFSIPLTLFLPAPKLLLHKRVLPRYKQNPSIMQTYRLYVL